MLGDVFLGLEWWELPVATFVAGFFWAFGQAVWVAVLNAVAGVR